MNNFIAYALTTIYGFIFSRVLWSFLVIINATYESEFKNYAIHLLGDWVLFNLSRITQTRPIGGHPY